MAWHYGLSSGKTAQGKGVKGMLSPLQSMLGGYSFEW